MSDTNENRNAPKHKLETADFLSFSDSPSTEFCPSNSSSPQKHWNQSHRNSNHRNWKNQRFSGNFHNNSYNSSERHQNRSFSGPYDNFQHKRYGSPNHSFSSPNHNYSTSFNSWSRKNSSFNSPKNLSEGGVNILSYLHPSFMEDPWAKLEREKLQQESNYVEPEVLNDSSSGSDEVPVEA